MGASPSPGGAIDLRYSSGPLWDNSSKSYPAQNVSPFPYNTATAHSSSISKLRKASASSSAVSALTALRFSGRVIETRYILPSWSVSTKVLFSLLEEATREGILKACGRIRRAKRESAILQESTKRFFRPSNTWGQTWDEWVSMSNCYPIRLFDLESSRKHGDVVSLTSRQFHFQWEELFRNNFIFPRMIAIEINKWRVPKKENQTSLPRGKTKNLWGSWWVFNVHAKFCINFPSCCVCGQVLCEILL